MKYLRINKFKNGMHDRYLIDGEVEIRESEVGEQEFNNLLLNNEHEDYFDSNFYLEKKRIASERRQKEIRISNITEGDV
jgi:hypothetical protein